MREDLSILILIILLVPLTGEFKIFPFHDTFRVGFGTSTFLFLLLWVRKIPLLLVGFIVGSCVVLFRMALDHSMNGAFQLSTDFILHFSSFFYYFIYSLLFYLTGINKMHHRPVIVGLLCVVIEISSNISELYFRHYILGDILTLQILGEIATIALIRSFFTLAFFYIIQLHQSRKAAEQQQEQTSHMLLLVSSLYEESIQLKKSQQNAEDITRDCYNIYQSLKENPLSFDANSIADKLLIIAGQVHEIKKDNLRIHAGISKIISNENSTDYLNISEICNIVIQSNRKYSLTLNKNIEFILKTNDTLPKLHVHTILSLLNNLVSNSVESIPETGYIKIFVTKVENMVEFKVVDNGPGIPKRKQELVFKPGYTTKYDLSGKPSTGIGLSYVKEVVKNLHGSINLLDKDLPCKETIFQLVLPIDNLIKKV